MISRRVPFNCFPIEPNLVKHYPLRLDGGSLLEAVTVE